MYAKDRDYLDVTTYKTGTLDIPLTYERFFIIYYNSIAKKEWVPSSYKYISLNAWIPKDTELFRAIQKGKYMNFLGEVGQNFPWKNIVSEDAFARIISRDLKVNVTPHKWKKLTARALIITINTLYRQEQTRPSIVDAVNFDILNDVYERIRNESLSGESIDEGILIEWAIDGMAKTLWDPYTVFFPQEKSTEFMEQLDGNFEGIWVQLEEKAHDTGIKIMSVMSGTPAEKSGLLSGDIITRVDDYTITSNTTTNELIRRIKGPKGTTVKLTITRGSESKIVSIMRDRIQVEYVHLSFPNDQTAYIQIQLFGNGVDKAFSTAMKALSGNMSIQKLIIDLRDNPGGSLEGVTNMLSYFVPKWKVITEIKTKDEISSIHSEYDSPISWEWKDVIILVNWQSASASEIMASVIREYVPSSTLIGTKTYGKWSVQTINAYGNGSSFKYTIAKWYTGKLHTSIDKVGIMPDITLPFDTEGYLSFQRDNQLEYALEYKKRN